MTDPSIENKILSFIRLLKRHRGEASGAYDEVAPVYDRFTKVWDHFVAGPALEYYNHLLRQRVNSDPSPQ